jgi:hypothetical protein
VVRLDTSPTHATSASPADQTIGKALVPASPHAALTASLKEDPSPFACPKKVICRNGPWVFANIGNGTVFPAVSALQFELHWSKLLVSKLQTVKNLVVLHAACPVGCTPVQVSRRCAPADPLITECLTDVVESATEFKATLHARSNGYMR